MDDTYADLPPVGTPDSQGRLRELLLRVRNESANIREKYTIDHDPSLNQYHFGREEGRDDTLSTFNKTGGMIDTFVSIAMRTPPSVSLEPVCIGMPPIAIDPTTGALLGMEEMVEYFQSIFDMQWERARLSQFLRENVWLTQLYGFQYALYQWDEVDKKPVVMNIPAKQWYPDPTVAEIKDMVYLGLDYPMDANLAKRTYPEATAAIDAYCSRAIQFSSASQGYSSVYTEPSLARPFVTLSITWMRNQEVAMTPDEAVGMGMVNAVQLPDVPPPMPQEEAAEGMAQPADTGEMPPESPGSIDMPQETPMRSALVHAQTGQEIDPAHPQWPRKYALRRTMQILEVNVSDAEETAWDIPVLQNLNTPYPNRPYGQPEPMRVRSEQRDLNDVHNSVVRHVRFFTGPTSIGPKSIQESLPEDFKNAPMKPNAVYWIPDDIIAATNGKPIQTLDPPVLPPSVMEVKRDLEHTFDSVGSNPDSLQGKPVTSNASGTLQNQVQSAAETALGFKFMFLEETVYRLSRLLFHDLLHNMTPDDLMRYNRKYPVEVVGAFVEAGKTIEWDVKVEIGNSQAKAQKEARVMQMLQTFDPITHKPLIDLETARNMLGLDHRVIEQRINQQMAPAAVAGAVPGVQPQLTGQPQMTGQPSA